MKKKTLNPDKAVRVLDFPDQIGKGNGEADSRSQAEEFASLGSIIDRLGPACDWSSRIVSAKFLNGYAVVVVSISIAGLQRDGIGVVPATNDGAMEHAERRALADAVSKVAVSPPGALAGDAAGFNDARTSKRICHVPEARSLRDLVSYAQLSRAKWLARSLDVSADEESERIFGCSLTELSRDSAEEFIQVLEHRASGTSRFKRAV